MLVKVIKCNEGGDKKMPLKIVIEIGAAMIVAIVLGSAIWQLILAL